MPDIAPVSKPHASIEGDCARIAGICVQERRDPFAQESRANGRQQSAAIPAPAIIRMRAHGTYFRESIQLHPLARHRHADHEQLPHKVFNDCMHCPKFLACDEIAMTRWLSEDAQPPAPLPGAPQRAFPLPRRTASYTDDGPQRPQRAD